jgi:hypothetical protein
LSDWGYAVVTDTIRLGACCACGVESPLVRNIITMESALAPVPGTGWGCSTCHLLSNGAIAIVCDACARAEAIVRWVVDGMPVDMRRAPVEAHRGVWTHQLRYHPEMQVVSWMLTQEEVDALPAGAAVQVIWLGGNGPHKYTIIGHDHEGHARVDHVGPPYDVLNFVGFQRYHTRVWELGQPNLNRPARLVDQAERLRDRIAQYATTLPKQTPTTVYQRLYRMHQRASGRLDRRQAASNLVVAATEGEDDGYFVL